MPSLLTNRFFVFALMSAFYLFAFISAASCRADQMLSAELEPTLAEANNGAEQGGGFDAVIDLPMPIGISLQCVQGAGGSYSHSSNSTALDIDLDTNNAVNEEVYAPTSGIAFVHTESATTNFGYHVNIALGDGSYIVVAHLSAIFVTDGAEVAAGQLIGYEGCTGSCTGDHIHIGRHEGDAAQKAEYGTSIEVAYFTEDTNGSAGFQEIPSDEFICGLSSMGDDVDGHWYRSALPVTRWHPNGTLVKTPDAVQVYRLDQGQARWISSEEVFSSYEYDFKNVATIADEELACYGKGPDIGEEGLVDAVEDGDGQRWLVVGPETRADRYRIMLANTAWEEVLRSWGLYYNAENPPPIDESSIYLSDWPERDGYAVFRDGSLLKEESRSDVYVVTDGVAAPIKDWETYLLLGFFERAIIIVPDDAVGAVQGAVGDCGVDYWCVDKEAVTTCGGGFEFGDGETGGEENEQSDPSTDSTSSPQASSGSNEEEDDVKDEEAEPSEPGNDEAGEELDEDDATPVPEQTPESGEEEDDEDDVDPSTGSGSVDADENPDEGDEDETAACTDRDHDGYCNELSGGVDCWDTNADVNPGETEICGDGIDQDCSGEDERCSDEETDTDGDGVMDAFDNCPLHDNSDQSDANEDGLGDACDVDDSESVDPSTDSTSSPQTGSGSDEESDGSLESRTLRVSWTTPFSAVAQTITLYGEYIFEDGSYGFTWRQMASVADAASIAFAIDGVRSADTLRFSAEYEDASGIVSWSCIAPYPPGTLQGTALADVDGIPLSIQKTDDPESDGCGLLVEVP